MVNQSHKDLFICSGIVFDCMDTVLPVAEFAFNGLVDRSILVTSFEIITGYRFGKPIDLLLLGDRPSNSAESFA